VDGTSDHYYQSSHKLVTGTQKRWKMEGQGTQKFHFLGKSVYIYFLYYFTLCRLNLKVQANFEPALVLTGHLFYTFLWTNF
jgi:hypothetical protein